MVGRSLHLYTIMCFIYGPSWPPPHSRGSAGTLWSLSLPHPADAGGDGDGDDDHEQHRADRHAGDDAGHGAVNSEHVVVEPGKDVADAHEGGDESCAVRGCAQSL
eukprot:scaffold31588_cov64-Phaeocystis_antarctica.AAC.6